MKSAFEGLVLRPAQDADQDFLLQVYASSRAEEMRATGWSEAQQTEFLRMQFGMQDTFYRAHYPDAAFSIVQLHGQDIGRHYLRRGETLFSLIDIALLPAWRGRGIGSALLNGLLEEARDGGCDVQLHVEIDNPAQRLYARLGFQRVGINGVYEKLRWHCRAAQPA